MRPRRLAKLVVAACLLELAAAGRASAEIALLANGSTLKVSAWAVAEGSAHLRLKEGGDVSVPAPFLTGVVPDELIEEIEQAALQAPAADLETLLQAAAARHGLEPALVRAVVSVESAFRARAVSPKGALGLMQLMPSTAAAVGVQDAFDPAQNLEGGTRHLASLLRAYGGDLQKALAAYNAGAGAVARYGGVPPYRETRDYVGKVLRKYKGAP